MSKYRITYDERGPDIQVGDWEIAVDNAEPDRIEIYRLDSNQQRIEGGTFKLSEFMATIEEFYNKNFWFELLHQVVNNNAQQGCDSNSSPA